METYTNMGDAGERGTALIKRLNDRAEHGAHRGHKYEMFLYALDECMELATALEAAETENRYLRSLLAKEP